jgi:hypothetical protein
LAKFKGACHRYKLKLLDSKEFAKRYLLEEIEKIEAANARLHLLMAIANGIETAGALLDELPYKAKGQGKKRFELALRKLFSAEYLVAHRNIDLYSQLRSHLAHSMIPSDLLRIEDQGKLHLQMDQKVLIISLRSLFEDYRCAIEKLIGKMEANELRSKRISFENLNGIRQHDQT